ncbi:hypothetical protein [Streptomyces microflavus]|uniref:hypothetical protein n=1 Tax=Streptomyces microflavus TaxID=1919 RepID=UPI0033D95543
MREPGASKLGICGINVPPDGERLRPLGIQPRMARNSALVELVASELPAVVVSRLLGIHQNTADTWRHISGQDNTYASEIARRY